MREIPGYLPGGRPSGTALVPLDARSRPKTECEDGFLLEVIDALRHVPGFGPLSVLAPLHWATWDEAWRALIEITTDTPGIPPALWERLFRCQTYARTKARR